MTSDQNEMAEPLNTDRDWSWLVVQPLWTKLIQIQQKTKMEEKKGRSERESDDASKDDRKEKTRKMISPNMG